MKFPTRSGCPKPEMLLAYQDNALVPDEHNAVVAHLGVCERCCEYLAASNELGVLLRRHIPLVDDPVGLAELKRRLREPPSPPSTFRQRIGAGRLVTLGVAFVALLSVGLVTTQTIQGGSSFTEWFSDDAPVRQTRPDGAVGETPLVVPSPDIGTPVLPYGLLPVSDGSGPAGVLMYRSTGSLAVALMTEAAGESQIYVDSGATRTEIVGVAGREVYMTFNDTLVGEAVVSVKWIAGDKLVTVLVIEQPPEGLTIDAAVEIASSLMTLESD